MSGAEAERAAGRPLAERVAAVETQVHQLRQDRAQDREDRMQDRELLEKIHFNTIEARAKTETVLERLDSGEEKFQEHGQRLAEYHDRLRQLELEKGRLYGGDGRPSFSALQDAHIKRQSTHGLLGRAWTAIVAIGSAAAGGVISFWLQSGHGKP